MDKEDIEEEQTFQNNFDKFVMDLAHDTSRKYNRLVSILKIIDEEKDGSACNVPKCLLFANSEDMKDEVLDYFGSASDYQNMTEELKCITRYTFEWTVEMECMYARVGFRCMFLYHERVGETAVWAYRSHMVHPELYVIEKRSGRRFSVPVASWDGKNLRDEIHEFYMRSYCYVGAIV